MSIRNKTLIILGLTILSLISILFAISQGIITGGFASLEESDTRQAVEVISAVFDLELERLHEKANDFTWLAVTVKDLQGDLADYIPPADVLAEQQISFLMVVSNAGELVAGTFVDLATDSEMAVPESLTLIYEFAGQFAAEPLLNSDLRGIVMLPEGPVMIACVPVVTSKGRQNDGGVVVTGLFLEHAALDQFSGTHLLSVALYDLDDPQLPERVRRGADLLFPGTDVIVQALDSEHIAGYTLLDDLHGNPVLVMEAQYERGVFQKGQASVRYFMFALLAIGLAFGVMTLFVIETYVLTRLIRLGRGVNLIAARGNLTERITMSGNDELAQLAKEINRLLDRLQKADQRLRDDNHDFSE